MSQPRLSYEGAQNAGMRCWLSGEHLGEGKDQAGRRGRWGLHRSNKLKRLQGSLS